MKCEMFERKGRLASVRHNVFRVFRFISGSREEECNVSSPTCVSTVAPYEPVNSLTGYSLEAELKKAQALAYSHMWEKRPR